MRRFIHCIWLFTVLFGSMGLKAQQIVTIIENHGSQRDTVAFGYNKIVDINSSLELHISKDSLIKVINDRYPQLMKQLSLEAEIQKLETALKDQGVILKGLRQQVVSAQTRGEFYQAARDFVNFIADPANGMEEEVNGFYTTYRETYSNPRTAPLTSLEFVYLNLNQKLQEVKASFAAIDNAGVMISLVGYKKDKAGGSRVHIKNFDTSSDLDYVTIPRWVTSLSDTQQKKLNEMSDTLANNKVELQSIFNSLKAQFRQFFPDISCMKTLRDDVQSLLSDSSLISAIPADVNAAANDFIKSFDGISLLSNALKTSVGNWDIETILSVSEAIREIISDVQQIDTDLSTLLNKISTVTKLKQWYNDFKPKVGTCFSVTINEFEKLKNVAALLVNQQQNYIANKDIGEDVLSFSVGNLPTVGYLNLKGTGQRSDGDEILIEVVMRSSGSKSGGDSEETSVFSKPITLEETNLVMQMVGIHSQVVVGMIFADPMTTDASVADPSKRHFFTPAASLLLKFGSRNSNFYNNFVDFGIGLNFASPDFDLDGNPEFGTGIIGTALKDILSVGVNYNVSKDVFYWFFGVNLPFNIPGIPINSVQTTGNN